MDNSLIKFQDFLKRYKITFVVCELKINSENACNFIRDCILNFDVKTEENKVKILTELPECNESDYLIINLNNNFDFEELTHKKFLSRNYTKYPNGIIIVLTFENLVDIESPFLKMQSLTIYKIPILYFSVSDQNTNFEFNMINKEFYDDSLKINPPDDSRYLHISNLMTFKYKIIQKLTDLPIDTEKLEIFCYYTDENKSEWIKIIKKYNEIQNFYKSVMNGKMLRYNNNEICVI